MANIKTLKFGKVERVILGDTTDSLLEIPDLIAHQKKSYKHFLEEGFKEVLKGVSGVSDFNNNLVLDYAGFKFAADKPNYDPQECKEKDATYSAPLKLIVRLWNNTTGKIKDSEIFLGDFPLMTDSGTFIINGVERVIVAQLVRSPGCYFKQTFDRAGRPLFSANLIPNKGAWIEYESDAVGAFYVRIDKNKKVPLTCFIRVLGLDTDEKIIDFFGDNEFIRNTLDKDFTKTLEEALFELYRKIRPGDPPTVDGAQSYINTLFFDPRRYDTSKVGRFKFNKKLNIKNRLKNKTASRMVINPITGEVLVDVGEFISAEKAQEISKSGVNEVFVKIQDGEYRIISNGFVNINDFVSFDAKKECDIKEDVRFSVLMELIKNFSSDEKIFKEEIKKAKRDLSPYHIIIDDIFASINYMFGIPNGIGEFDDIDHLGNRRVRLVGELLQNQFKIGFSRLERLIKERMTLQTQDLDVVTPHSLINIRPIIATIKEFFGSSPLSQFMDQINPLSGLTHKRRLSAIGPGGLSRERAGFEVRDVHYTHYGRICPIETPEGINIGLISYLAFFAKINEYGFIEAPFRVINKKTNKVTNEIVYLTADEEDEYIVAQASEKLNDDGSFCQSKIRCRFKDEFIEVENNKADLMDVSPKMVVSVSTAMIPFLENDDAIRALMGANMQKQAVPLIKPEAPIVATGVEYEAGIDSKTCVIAEHSGYVKQADASSLIVKYDNGKEEKISLIKFKRSNQSTCFNQKVLMSKNQRFEKNEVLVDGPGMKNGEISIGRNVLVGFMPWDGFNYEDAVLISEKIVRDDVYTSIHIEEYALEARDTKLGPEEITRDIPNISEDALSDLDDFGIIRVGAQVRAGDILVGKITPKGETELTSEERLLRAIFGEKAREVRDTSLRIPHGEGGIVVDVRVFDKNNSKNEIPNGVNKVVRCYVAQKRKISVGDKMAGRHGNKGVVSRILPVEDMPYLPDGTPLDIVLNSLGVPARMNIGQILEAHLGLAAKIMDWKVITPVFESTHEDAIFDILKENGFDEQGKVMLRDGRNGEYFDNPVTVGVMYYLKLHHLVDDKIHARSTGPYSLVTQQPLGGKSRFGGQRFGEMEVWALEAYGAAYSLQEMLTIKSDDINGRVKTYEAIVKGNNIPKPGVPESFKVLVKELQSMGLDITMLDEQNNEIDLKQEYESESVSLGFTNKEEFEIENKITEPEEEISEEILEYEDSEENDANDGSLLDDFIDEQISEEDEFSEKEEIREDFVDISSKKRDL